MQLAIEIEVDRFCLALDTIKRVPRLSAAGAAASQRIRVKQTAAVHHANEFGIDSAELADWSWPDDRTVSLGQLRIAEGTRVQLRNIFGDDACSQEGSMIRQQFGLDNCEVVRPAPRFEDGGPN